MHLYLMTRGHEDEVRKYIDHLKAQYFLWPNIHGPGKHDHMQLGVRPIQLWEITFPRDSLPQVLKCATHLNTPVKDWRAGFFNSLRMAMRLKKIPKMNLSAVPELAEIKGKDGKTYNEILHHIYKRNVAVYPIGIKEDKNFEGPEYL